MRSTHTSTTKSTSSNPHFQNTTSLPYSPPQNCFKSPHNSINHFDTDFDTPPKYLLTTTTYKLSDNYIIHQKLPKSGKNTPLSHSFITQIPSPSIPKSSLNQDFKQISPHHKPTSRTPLATELTSKHPTQTKNNPTKIRPESTDPRLKLYFTTSKNHHY